MNEQNERINENGMNPDSNNIENETGRDESVNFVLKENGEQNRPPYEGPYRGNESQYYNGTSNPQNQRPQNSQPQNGQPQNSQPQNNQPQNGRKSEAKRS